MVDDLLVYHDARNTIFVVPFDVRRWRVTGSAMALVDSVGPNAALSHAGTLMFLRAAGEAVTQLVELDMAGNTRAVLPVRQRFSHPRYSPDARRILVGVTSDSIPELWIHDTRAGTLSPAVRGFYGDHGEWSPDGHDLLFVSRQGGLAGLWRQRADGTVPRVHVQRASERGQPVQGIFTPDDRHIVYRTGFNGDDVWYRAWEGDTVSHPLAADPSFLERNTAISPDGRWAAYASDESGTYQVYVRPFPAPCPRSRDHRGWWGYARVVAGRTSHLLRQWRTIRGSDAHPRPRFRRDAAGAVRAQGAHGGMVAQLGPVSRRQALPGGAGGDHAGSPPRAMVIHNWAADVRALRAGQPSR
jgi:hypothetical protein